MSRSEKKTKIFGITRNPRNFLATVGVFHQQLILFIDEKPA